MIYLLIGEARSGKTTFVKNINCDFANDSRDLRYLLLNGSVNIALDDYIGTDDTVNSMLKYLYDYLNGKLNAKYFMGIDKDRLPKNFNIFIVTKPNHLKNTPRSIIARCKPIYFNTNDGDLLEVTNNEKSN